MNSSRESKVSNYVLDSLLGQRSTPLTDLNGTFNTFQIESLLQAMPAASVVTQTPLVGPSPIMTPTVTQAQVAAPAIAQTHVAGPAPVTIPVQAPKFASFDIESPKRAAVSRKR